MQDIKEKCNMFVEDIILAVLGADNVDELCRRYQVSGIMTNEVATPDIAKMYPSLKIYDYSEVVNIGKAGKMIVAADTFWEDGIRDFFWKLLDSYGLKLGSNFLFASMLDSVADTNAMFEMVDRDSSRFADLLKSVAGNRKFVVVHGNCQTHAVIRMLAGNRQFCEKYFTCIMPKMWENEKEKMEMMIESGVFGFADCLVTQVVSEDNKFGNIFSTEFLKSLIPNECKVITISNLFFMGYFPQYRKMKNNPGVNFLRDKIWDGTQYFDKNIIAMIADDKSDEEIIAVVTDNNYYPKEKLVENIRNEIEEFAASEKDKKIDIKMADYLDANFNRLLLFVTSNHPTREVLMVLSRRILKELGIERTEIDCPEDEIQAPMPREWRYLIYPSVLKQLGLEKNWDYFYRAICSKEEIVLFDGIEAAVVTPLENSNLYFVKVKCDFETFIRIYIRASRAALMQL